MSINWHKLGFHRYSNKYMTYGVGSDLRQQVFYYCSCGKWKHNDSPLDEVKHHDLSHWYSKPVKQRNKNVNLYRGKS